MHFNFHIYQLISKMAFRDFTQCSVWQKALQLLKKVYEVTENYPEREKYGMTSDMRRSANSVCHNFSEGFGRYEKKDKTRFYKISRGSSYEIIGQSIASYTLYYLSIEDKEILIDGYKDIIKELDQLVKSVETRQF